MLKRAGQGQDPAGASATAPGELAVECPACPHPGHNLPEDWEGAGPLSYMYTLFVAIDANVKLKRKNCGINDPELAPGWATFVEEGSYQNHIKNYIDQLEINTCQSEHDAVVRAAVRCTPGYSVTGTGLCVCSRHCLVRKNGVGDLQKGEKYCNMDYIIPSSLAGTKLPRVVLSYNIGLPENLQLDPNVRVEVGVPTWHINGHGDDCKANFSLGYMPGVGWTCGEDVETTWAQTNSLGTSIREMGPGARHETLDDQWCGLNFRKIVGFLRKWEEIIFEWRVDKSKLNPYKEPALSTTLQDDDTASSAQGLVYMPCITSLTQTLTTNDPASIEPAESISLHLPSSLPQSLRQSPELSTVIEKERRLYVAQADDALANIRCQCWIISGLWQFKKLNVDGMGNRACNYCVARDALVALDPNGSWQSCLQVLRDADIRGPGKDEQVLDDSLQVEWSKCHARMQRWEEEVVIIQEEMRRVIAYHEWKAQWWRSQAARHSDTDNVRLHGVTAYAKKQAHLSEQLAWQCAEYWLPALKERGVSPEWEERYPVTPVDKEVQEDLEDKGFEGCGEIDDEERELEEYGDSDDRMAYSN
ncbi:hypothetical protein V8E52_009414 [Russula decolorans]